MKLLGWILAPIRLVLLFVHIVIGLSLTLTIFRVLSWPVRQRIIQKWSWLLVKILGVRINVVSAPVRMPMRGLLVSNHTSWIDIFVTNAIQPVRFIAKSDVKKWPVLGTLVTSVGTLYVERGNRHLISQTNKEITDAAGKGDLIGLYPEGTTTDGTYLLPFKSNLFQPAIDSGLHVYPLAVSYSKGGKPSQLASYVGDTSLFGSFWQLASSIGLTANLHYCPIIPAAQYADRTALTKATEEAVSRALGKKVIPAEVQAQVLRGV